MRRKFLSVVLCVCMMLTMVPFAFAADDSGDSTNNNVSTGSGGGTVIQAVAQIDNTTYNTLSDAITAAENGKTITLLKNTSGEVVIPTDKNITLDLNGNTITHTGTTVYNLGNLTICDSSNDKTGKIISTRNVGVGVGHDSTTTIEYANIEAVEGAVITGYATGATITINDGKFSASDNAVIAGNGNNTDNNATGKPVRVNPNKINILGGTFTGNIQTNGYIACGIYAPWKDIITVSGGNFIVNNGIGIVARAGQVTVTGGSFTCNGTAKGKVGDKDFDMDAAQSVYFDASDPAYPAYNSETDYIKLLGGTFSSDVTNYVAENYTCIQNNDKYTVKPLNEVAVAKIGDNLYTSLSAAISAASDGQTVTLLKNATENVNISAEKSVAINLNGYTVTVPSDCGIELQGKLTVTGSGKITCANTPICVDGNSAKLTVNDGTIESTNDYGIYAENGGSVVVNGGTISSKNAALSGNNTTGSMNFTVNSGTLTAAQGPAIYMPGQVSLNISGGTLNGGVSLRMGQVNISGGTINAITENIDSPSQYYNYSGNAWLPDALYVFGGTYSDGDTEHGNSLNLNISGGIFNCANGQGSAVAIYDIGKVSQDANITISGNAKLATNAPSRSAYQVLSLADIGVNPPANGYGNPEYTNKVNSSITGGYFTSDPSAYCVSGKTGIPSNDSNYPFTVGTLAAANVDVAPAAPKADADTTKITDDNVKQAMTSAAASAADTSATGLDAIGGNEAKDVTDTEVNNAKTTLSNSGVTVTNKTVTLYVQPYLDITVTGAKVENSATTELSLSITPMVKKVASTATTASAIETDGTGKNAVQIGTAEKVENVNTPVTIKLALPNGFANTNDKLSIKHTKENGSVEYYTGIVSVDSGKTYVTFTTNGFSPFVISAPVASIGDDVYPSLQAAVDAVQNGQTIKLEKDCAETATVSRAVNFTLNKNSKDFTGAINAGSKYNLTKANGEGTAIIYTVTYVGGGSSSSGTPTTTYAVNVNAATNGAVAADKKTASKGTTVTVTASPSKGYVVDAVKVVDKDGKDVAVTEKDGKYVFTMPASAVTVTGSFKAETPAPVALPFTDVKSGNWFYDAVKYAYAQGLMTGTSATTFAPNGTMNRAMIVTVLYRLEKSPAVTGASKFTDVPAGQWYSDAVAWAAANKIVNGYDETTFGPMNAVTREQMAAILFRYEQVKGLENVTLEENLNRFPDQNKISAYAIPALQWAVGQKIINGNADGTLDPTGTATRAQVAQIFTNLLNQ